AAMVASAARLVQVRVEDGTGRHEDVHHTGLDQVADHAAQSGRDERAGETEIDGWPLPIGEHALEHLGDAAQGARLDAGVGILCHQIDDAGAARHLDRSAGPGEDGAFPLPLLGREGGKPAEAATGKKRLHAGSDVACGRPDAKAQWLWWW